MREYPRLMRLAAAIAEADQGTSGRILLRTEGVCLGRSRRNLLNDVSVNVEAGEIVGVLGPNGAGKTALLAAIASLWAGLRAD